MISRIVFALFAWCFALCINAQTAVELHGQLSVDGAHVKDEHGEITQLRGMSFFWHQWNDSYTFWTQGTLEWLRDDWMIDYTRGAVGIHSSGWFQDSVLAETSTEQLIEASVEAGLYVVIDWHSHDIHLPEAKGFFSRIAQKYGHHPNVVYEIYNEPTGSSWTDLDQDWPTIKEYAMEMIATIREHDPDNIIIVATPFYDQFVHHAADDPLTVDANGDSVSNIVYTLHIYAGSHKNQNKEWAQEAVDKGLPMWVTESGRTQTSWGPDNPIDPESYDDWVSWWDENGISYSKWSLSNKNEVSSSLLSSASTTGGWTSEDLRSEGLWNRNHFRKKKCPTCPYFDLGKAEVSVTEANNGTAEVSIVLGVQPAGDVVFTTVSNDDTESSADDRITFTPENWDTPQTITVAAVNDTIIDSDVRSEIRVRVVPEETSDEYDDLFDQIIRVVTVNDDKKKDPVVVPLSLDENALFQVYPNPVIGDNFTVNMPHGTVAEITYISILDLSGAILFEKSFYSDKITLPTDIFPARGVYLIRAKSQYQEFTSRLIIK